MRVALAFLIISGLVGVAGFGIWSMSHGDMQSHDGNCFAATAQGTDCVWQNNPIDYLIFHLGAFKNFSTATLNSLTASFLIFSFFAAWFISRILSVDLALQKSHLAHERLNPSDSFAFSAKRKFIHWLALHENSPSSL